MRRDDILNSNLVYFIEEEMTELECSIQNHLAAQLHEDILRVNPFEMDIELPKDRISF